MLTIDDRRTRDIDDAFEVIETQEGWIVKVAISDVGSRVEPGSTSDLIARRRGATRYHARGNEPMLPRILSDQKLSLWPNYNRKCLGIIITLSKDLEVTAKEMALVVIASQAKLAYSNIPEILKDSEHPQHIQITLAQKLALGLLTKRRNSGAMVFYDLNNGWVTTEDGFLKKLKSREDTIGYIIIQELMILANVCVATIAVEQDVPILFRNHEARSATPEREALMQQIADAIVHPALYLETLQKRTNILFDRARYGSKLLGHYGLNVPAYTHFTSPIRRYADLVVHQQFRAKLKGLPFPYTQEQLDEIAQHLNDLAQAERDSAKEHYKTKAEDKARLNIEDGNLDTVSPKDFERALKVELGAGAGPSDNLITSWVNRLENGTIPPVCMTELLMTLAEQSNEGWESLLEATLEALDEKPEDAVTVLTQAASMGWKETTYDVVQGGPQHMPSFTVTAVLPMPQHDTTYTAKVSCKNGGTLKQVKQVAAFKLLNMIAHRLEIHDNYVQAELQLPGVEQAKVEAFTGKHPVSALMEIHQSKSCPPPKFDFEMSGPPHTPTVKCTGVFLGQEVQTTASSKQEAKKLAAQALLDLAQGTRAR